MNTERFPSRLSALILGFAALALTGWAAADPPTRVARLGYISGAVSFSPAGEDEWVHAVINRPLISGDRLWVTPGARAELQVGVGAVRMSGSTSVTLLNIDDRTTQLELVQGTLNIRVRRLGANRVFEIDTPNLAFSLHRPGNYRIDVDPADDATTVLVSDGEAEVFGEGEAYTLRARESYRYYGTGLRDYDRIDRPRVDEFDRWSSDRDRRAEGSASLRYVSPDVIGYEDLDAYGTWRSVSGYGNVWVPSRVEAGWAPYRDGHWAWVEPWGWTWVDDAPWGFAVSHYGRWANMSGTWGWVPGPVRQQAVYAPALVAFVGGSNFRLSISSGNVGGIAWFPLGPRDVYRPSYAVSRDYFTRINTSNTIVSNVNITNVYNNTNVTNITYVNQRIPGAVVAVPTTAFVQSQPVSRAAVHLTAQQITSVPVSAVAAVAPVQRSVVGPTPQTAKPAMNRVERPVVARTAPPPAPVAFAARESALAATPGKPLAPPAAQTLKPAGPAAPAPRVVVVEPAKPAVPMAKAEPSKPAPGAGARGEAAPAGQRGRADKTAPPSDTSVKPLPAAPGASQPATQPAPAPSAGATAPGAGVPPGQRGRAEPASPPPPQAPQAPQPPAAAPTVRPQPAPQAIPQPPVAKTPEPRASARPPEQPAPPAVSAQPAPPPPAAAPAQRREPPPERPREQPAPPVIKAQPAPPQPAPPPPAAAPPERRTPPAERPKEQPAPPASNAPPPPAPPAAARPPERPASPPAAQAQPRPSAPPPNAEQRGPAPKAAPPKAEEKKSPEQIKQEELQRQEEEKKGKKPN